MVFTRTTPSDHPSASASSKGGVLLPFVNVRSRGATGDGITNDTSAIAAAITEAGVGGAVYFPTGTYRAPGLAPLSGQRWFGPGTLKLTAGYTGDLIAISGKDRVSIDLDIDGGWTTTLTGNPGPGLSPIANAVNITGSTRCRVTGRISNVQGCSSPHLQLVALQGDQP
jgi:hypothetical protein